MHSREVASDIEIAQAAKMLRIEQVADRLGIGDDDLDHFGKYKAKVSLDVCARSQHQKSGKLVLVSAITPTPAGEGKTTTTIGLGDALNRLGRQTTICVREPSLGPCFGLKGGAAGGGYAQIVPMEDINLHFTGDFHAIGLAHNLLAAAIDNHIHHGNVLEIDPLRVTWKRVMDMNDRALRRIVVGPSGNVSGSPRKSGFDITVASEVMAIFCLAESLTELRQRLGQMVVGYNKAGEPVTAEQTNVHGAMAVLLRDALKPNIVQTLENNPALVHGGPFANIAHGCNSVVATKLAMGLSDYTVTEAGFAADLGAEKFMNIKCRQADIRPDAVVLVATVRALKMHGGVDREDLHEANPDAVARGCANLEHHIYSIRQFGLPVVVAINAFTDDTDAEIRQIQDCCESLGVQAVRADHWARGGTGAEDLATAVIDAIDQSSETFRLLYPDDMHLLEKVRTIAREIYGASDIVVNAELRSKFAALEQAGHGKLPVCMAKTQYSLSTDPTLKGRPKDFELPLRDVALSAGAGFVVVYAGNVLTMPGLPRVPAAEAIDIDEQNEIVGLF